MIKPIQLISAASILGLKPSGVEKLPESLLANGLAAELNCVYPGIEIPLLNDAYSATRDGQTGCLNPEALQSFSLSLGSKIKDSLRNNSFPVVLGGDCTILLGILSALKSIGLYGLLFCDAHADFYEPEKSITGEVADMELAIVTGRGPEILTNLDQQKPYVQEQHIIHIGQRDQDETIKYHSQDIRNTKIHCFDYYKIHNEGIAATIDSILNEIDGIKVESFWLHFDTDVISDNENPAVDYRLPGGLSSDDCTSLLQALISTDRIAGMSVTIFNPTLDEDGKIAKMLTRLISDAFKLF